MSLPFDLDSFVQDYAKPLQLVTRAQLLSKDCCGVTLQGETTRFMRQYRDRYGTWVEIARPEGVGDPVTLGIEFCTPHILRVRMQVGRDGKLLPLPENRTPMVVNDFSERDFPLCFTQTDLGINLESESLGVKLTLRPWQVEVYETVSKKVLFRSLPAAVFQQPPTGESHLDGATITDAWPWFFRGLFPLGFVRDEETGLTQVFETATLWHDEHFYGFGEKFSPIDKRGQSIQLWQANATGNTWPQSYKNIPFFISTRGYGLFINSSYPIQYHMGDRSYTRYSFHVQQDLLDYYFIYGPKIKDIIPRYTLITGTPALPPLWSFGLWMSRMSYRSQDEVESIAEQLRANDIPCDVIHVDTDWFERPWVNDLTFSRERFPKPRQMIERLRSKGFRVTLWQLPYIAKESRLYAEGERCGFFAKRADGTPYLISGFFGPAAVIDFSNPDAVAWYQSKVRQLLEMGVSAIKTDFGEGAPPDAYYANVDGLAMHNLYPLLYNRAIFELTQTVTGEGIVWGRSAYAGSQRYPVHWGGDPASLWDDLANLWHGGLGLGLCGFPFWSVDIGGFAGIPKPELYIRWAQAALFVTHPRAHGPIHREPWAFGEDALRIFRQYAKLRYRLIPYVWSSAVHSVETSLPIMRPLVLDWQDDPTTSTIDDQWLFGEFLLVAPILDEYNERYIYLPEGRWFSLFKDRVFDGPCWIQEHATLDELPIYVRGGAIIPLAPEMSYVDEKPWDPLTLLIYPFGRSSFTFVDRDGMMRTQIGCDATSKVWTITVGPMRSRGMLLKLYAASSQVDAIHLNGSKLERSEQESESPAWWKDKTGFINIRCQGGSNPMHLEISFCTP